jgi:sugar phosphate isomerase/epimerase
MISPATDPIGIAAIETMADVGFDYAELSLSHMAGLSDIAFDALCGRVGRSGIRCEACNNFFPATIRLTGLDVSLPTALDYAHRAIARAAALGARIIVFGSSGAKNVPPGFSHDIAWRQIAELLKCLGPIADEHGITIAIEALNREESNIVNLISEAMRLVLEVGHPAVRLLADFYHMAMEHEGLDVIPRAASALRHVHVAAASGRRFPQSGDDGLARFLACLHNAGYAGRCSIEAYTDAFASDAARAIALLRDLIAKSSQEVSISPGSATWQKT